MVKTKKTVKKNSTTTRQNKTVEVESPVVEQVVEELVEETPEVSEEQVVEETVEPVETSNEELDAVAEELVDETVEESQEEIKDTCDESESFSEACPEESWHNNIKPGVYYAQKPPKPQQAADRKVYVAQKCF